MKQQDYLNRTIDHFISHIQLTWFLYAVIDQFWLWSKSIVFMNHACIHSSSSHQDSYLIYQFQLSLYWVCDLWKQVVSFQIISRVTELEISSQFIHHLHSWANLVIIMLAYQTSDLAYQIDTWSWSWIMIDTQLIVFVDVSIALWSWNTADSCDSLESSQRTLILQVLIIIVQNIILLQAVSYYRSCSSIQQHSVFMRRRQLSVTHHFYHIVRAHLPEHDQMSQLWECIQDQSQSEQISEQL